MIHNLILARTVAHCEAMDKSCAYTVRISSELIEEVAQQTAPTLSVTFSSGRKYYHLEYSFIFAVVMHVAIRKILKIKIPSLDYDTKQHVL